MATSPINVPGDVSPHSSFFLFLMLSKKYTVHIPPKQGTIVNLVEVTS